MGKEEFYNFIRDNFTFDSGMASRLLWNALTFIESGCTSEDEQYALASELLDGIGLSDAELRKICF